MSVVIKTDDKQDWRVSDVVEGESHDHCPSCDTDVEASDGFGGEHGTPRMWSQFVHDRKEGGCGAIWTRTTQYGLDRNTSRNAQTKWLTTGASAGRVYSLPSKAYEDGWERIYGHGK
jgi:hypothetical protein